MPQGEKKKYSKAIFLISTVVIASIILFAFKNQIAWQMRRYEPVGFYAQERDLVEAAMNDAYGPASGPDNMRDSVYPVVVYMPNMKCVGLNLKNGEYGETKTVCFNDSKSIILRYSE